MGYDLKYGTVTTHRHGGEIPSDEIVVVFRGRDSLLPALLQEYGDACEVAGSGAMHVALVRKTESRVRQWQKEHAERVKVPTSLESQPK